jgi:hypothetical protein
MSNNITRFGKGVLTDSYQNIYQVPVDFVAIIKTMSFSNIGSTSETISIKLDGSLVLPEETIEPGAVYNLKAYDQILEDSEVIEIKASSNDSISFYVSGVQAPIDNIGSETQWMKDRWDEWWENLGPDQMENEWQTWFESVQDSTYVTNSEVDQKIEDEMNIYEISFNDQLQSIQNTSDDAVDRVDSHIADQIHEKDVHGIRYNDTTGYMEFYDGSEWKEITSSEIIRIEKESNLIRQNQIDLILQNKTESSMNIDEPGYWYDSLINDLNFSTENIKDLRIRTVS